MEAQDHQVPWRSVGGQECCCKDTEDGPPYCFTELSRSFTGETGNTWTYKNTFPGARITFNNPDLSKRFTATKAPSGASIVWPRPMANFYKYGTGENIAPRIFGVRLFTIVNETINGQVFKTPWEVAIGAPCEPKSYRVGNWCRGGIKIKYQGVTQQRIVKGVGTRWGTLDVPYKLVCYMFNTFTRRAAVFPFPSSDIGPEERSGYTSEGFTQPYNVGGTTKVNWIGGPIFSAYQLVIYLETPWFKLSVTPSDDLEIPEGEGYYPSYNTIDRSEITLQQGGTPYFFHGIPGPFDGNASVGTSGQKCVYQQTAPFPWPENEDASYRGFTWLNDDLTGIPYNGVIELGSYSKVTSGFSKDITEQINTPPIGGSCYPLTWPNLTEY